MHFCALSRQFASVNKQTMNLKFWLEDAVIREDKKRRIVKVNEFYEEFNVVGRGENFLSEVSRVRLTCSTESGAEETRSYIVKKVPDSDAARLFHKRFPLFLRETQAYVEVLGRMKDLKRDKGDFREDPWCQLEGYIPGEVILLEDLNATGYQKLKKFDLLDEEHAVHVLTELSRFHAMGAALISRRIVDPSSLRALPILLEGVQATYYVQTILALKNAVEMWGSGWSDLLGPLNQIAKNLNGLLRQIEEINQNFTVLSHGDCWNGNFLFKKDFQGKILAMKFVDFQFLSPSSYIYDILVILNISVQKEIRVNQLDRLLHVYRDNLKVNAEYFGADCTIPTVDEIKSALASLDVVSFILMCIYYPVAGGNVEFDATDAFNDAKNKADAYNSRMYSNENCRRVLGEELRALIAKGLFSNVEG